MKKYEKTYEEIVPIRFKDASYENDVPDEVKKIFLEQVRKREGIYLLGEAGVGKTHIACAIGKYLLEETQSLLFETSGDLLEKIREDYEAEYNNKEDIFRTLMNFPGILILDDIGAEKTSSWVVERLYLILNKRYQDMLPTIFTSNCSIEELSEKFGDRITSRIVGMAAIVEINGEDKRIK